MEKIKIVALCGKAGSGKSYLLDHICADCPELHKIVSNTTRPQREGEQNGVAYHFLTEEEFKQKTMIEQTEFRGWFYGTAVEDLKKNQINIGVFNRTGLEVLRKMPNINLLDFYITASAKERVMRQLMREEHPDVDEIVRRYKTDEEDFEDFIIAPPRFILNPDVPTLDPIQYIVAQIRSWTDVDNILSTNSIYIV